MVYVYIKLLNSLLSHTAAAVCISHLLATCCCQLFCGNIIFPMGGLQKNFCPAFWISVCLFISLVIPTLRLSPSYHEFF